MQISTHNRQPSVGTLPRLAKTQVSDNPIERLPDLDILEARAAKVSLTTPTPETTSAPSRGQKAALLALGLGTALMAAAPSAHAHGYGYHHHYNYNYNYNGGNAGAIIGGAIAGAIIGGIIQQQAPPVYYPPQPVYQTPFYDGYNRLICPTQHGGWYVSPDNVRCW